MPSFGKISFYILLLGIRDFFCCFVPTKSSFFSLNHRKISRFWVLHLLFISIQPISHRITNFLGHFAKVFLTYAQLNRSRVDSLIWKIKNRPYAKHRDDINRGTTLLPVHNEQALGLRNEQKRHSLLFSFQECSSRGKFDSCLNQRELSAHDSLSLMENKSLLTRSKPFTYTISL